MVHHVATVQHHRAKSSSRDSRKFSFQWFEQLTILVCDLDLRSQDLLGSMCGYHYELCLTDLPTLHQVSFQRRSCRSGDQADLDTTTTSTTI